MSGRGRDATDPPWTSGGARLVAPSAERNRQPIVDALGLVFAEATGTVLEIGSGTGQHAVALAAAFPGLDWQPSDVIETHLDSIRAWSAESGHGNLRPPIRLDAAEPWPDLGPLAGVLAINVIHIAPWAVAAGILRGAAAALRPGGALAFYGPFKEGGRHTGEGNERFDAMLRAEDPAWGVRDLGELSALAMRAGLSGPAVAPMPSNNRLVVYRA